MVGVPGTGLGGVFYALLVIWMVVRETWLTLRGGGDLKRWRRIAWLGMLLAAIILALTAEGWLLQLGLRALPTVQERAGGIDGRSAMLALVPALAVAPFVILAAIIGAVHMARLTLGPPPAPLTSGYRAELGAPLSAAAFPSASTGSGG